ncbi:hypothetical protein D6779_03845, partial [Candidatus Parcubacteria bacterium]
LLDGAGIAYDIYVIRTEGASFGNVATLALDVVLAAAPFIPSIGGLKAAGKAASHGDEVVKGAETIASKGASTALRRVGDLLETAHDVMANPSLLEGKSMEQVRMMIDKTPGWVDDVMRHSTTHPNGGWVFREMNAAGTDFTGRMIQFHPGTPRHFGGQAYWKVSGISGQNPIRIPVNP